MLLCREMSGFSLKDWYRGIKAFFIFYWLGSAILSNIEDPILCLTSAVTLVFVHAKLSAVSNSPAPLNHQGLARSWTTPFNQEAFFPICHVTEQRTLIREWQETCALWWIRTGVSWGFELLSLSCCWSYAIKRRLQRQWQSRAAACVLEGRLCGCLVEVSMCGQLNHSTIRNPGLTEPSGNAIN